MSRQHIAEWVERVYGRVPGTLVVNYNPALGKFVGTGGQCHTHEAAVDRVAQLDESGAKGVYLRTTTVTRILGQGERGSSADAAYLPGLWADVDYGTIGHAHDPSKHGGLILPPDEAEARRIVETSGLPAPTLWVNSGGGLYPWWLLSEPQALSDDVLQVVQSLSSTWQETLGKAAESLGYVYGTGVGDLARVLRVPGTTNRKAGVERPCRVVEDNGAAYTLDELLLAVEVVEPSQSAPTTIPPLDVWESCDSESPFDRFAREHSWHDVMVSRLGWTICGEQHGPDVASCFTRPGNPENSCSARVLTVNEEVLVVWSENAGLPVGRGQKLTKARVVAHAEHRGSTSAFARQLLGGTSSANDATTEATLDAASAFADAVARQSYRLRVIEAARDANAAQKNGTLVLPRLRRLDAFLAEPDQDPAYRIDRLWPTGGRVVLSAQHKAGKTTTVANVLRSLVDDERLFDTFTTTPVGRVLLIDNELDERMMRRWMRDQAIANKAAVELLPLRGRLSTFDILTKATRSRWAEHLAAADVLVFDCLRPALDALSLDENRDAGRFLEALDELTSEAGISDTLVVHHMGHTGERSRGDSRILDWPDAVWKLVRTEEDQRRYFSANGRDVDHPESLLDYDPVNRRLSITGGSRHEAKADAALDEVLATLAESEPLSGRGIEAVLRTTTHTQKAIRQALKWAVERGHVICEKGGRGGGMLYRLAEPQELGSVPASQTALVRQSASQRGNALDDGSALVRL